MSMRRSHPPPLLTHQQWWETHQQRLQQRLSHILDLGTMHTDVSDATQNLGPWVVTIQVDFEMQYRSPAGPIEHVVTLSYAPLSAPLSIDAVILDSPKAALMDAITSLAATYGNGIDTFGASSKAFMAKGCNPSLCKPLRFYANTPDKLSDQMVAEFQQDLINELAKNRGYQDFIHVRCTSSPPPATALDFAAL